MKKTAIISIGTLVIIMAPFVAFACQAHSNVWDINILKGPLISCTGAGQPGGTDNANCQSVCDLVCTVANVVYFFIAVVIWIIAPILIAWSGILFLFSRGSTERTGQARKMITGTVIGLFIVLCAYLIISVFVQVMGISGIGGFGTSSCTIQ